MNGQPFDQQVDPTIADEKESFSPEPNARLQQEIASCQEARLRRALDDMGAANRKDDPRESNLGSAAAGMMLVSVELETALLEWLSSRPGAERFPSVRDAMDAYLRCTRQAQRYHELETRLAAQRTAAASGQGGEGADAELQPGRTL